MQLGLEPKEQQLAQLKAENAALLQAWEA